MFEEVEQENTVEAYERYITAYPNGDFIDRAKDAMVRVRAEKKVEEYSQKAFSLENKGQYREAIIYYEKAIQGQAFLIRKTPKSSYKQQQKLLTQKVDILRNALFKNN